MPNTPDAQSDLFGDAPSVSVQTRLVRHAEDVAHRPEQKRLCKLLQDIEKANRRLAEVGDLMAIGSREASARLEPALEKLITARHDLAFALAVRLTAEQKLKGFTPRLRDFAADVLADILPPHVARDDAALAPLYECIFGAEDDDGMGWNGIAKSNVSDEARAAFRGIGMPDSLIDQLRSLADGDASPPDSAPDKPRRRSARQLAAETAAQNAAQSAENALRTLYRQLARSLHPDRAADATAQALATERMARANVAYQAKDLQALLALQLETAQDGKSQLVNGTTETVNGWCDALAAQLAELKANVREQEAALLQAMGARPGRSLRGVNADVVREAVSASVREVEADLAMVAEDAVCVRDDARCVAWLKAQREVADIATPASMQRELNAMMQMLAEMHQSAPPPRRGARKPDRKTASSARRKPRSMA